METKTSPGKSSIQFGILFGVIMILELVISYVLNIGTENKAFGVVLNLLNYLVFPFIFIYLGCNNYKTKLNDGFISFGDCIKIGLSIAFIASFLYGVFYIVFNMIFPEFLPDMIEKIKDITQKENPNLTQEQLDMSMAIVQKVMNPYITAPLGIAINCFVALLHSLVIGAIVKKERPATF